jgi:glycosyltransferase 2 family protein
MTISSESPSNHEPDTNPASRKKTRSPWWYLGSAAVTLVSIAILAQMIITNLDTLQALRKSFRAWPVLLTLPVFFITEYISSLAWGKIMNDLTKPLPLRLHQIIFFVTHAARRIPGTIWHVIGRVAWYERLGIGKSISAFANVVETVLIILSGVIVSLILLPFIATIEKGQLWLFLGGALVSAALMQPGVIRFVMNKFGQQQYSQTLNYKKILVWFVYYPVLWIFGGLILYLTITGLTPVPLTLIPVCIAIWSIAGVTGMLFVLLPSGFGVSEATLSLLLAPHVSPGVAVTAAVLMRILLTAYEFFFAGIALTLRDRFIKSIEDQPKSIH